MSRFSGLRLRERRISFEQRYFPVSAKAVFTFLPLWLFTGFSLGTVLLLGPVRWIADLLSDTPVQHLLERALVVLIIVLLVVISFAIALRLTRVVLTSRKWWMKITTIVMSFAVAFGAYLLWINPRTLSLFMSEDQIMSTKFTFGPYPDQEKLQELKKTGFTTVVTLLHPAVVPFEPQLLKQEKENAEKVGIDLIHIPMLPWVAGTDQAAEEIRALARAPGRFYVHCYLGEDRVQLFRRILTQEGPGESSQKFAKRDLSKRKQFARGEIVELEPSVYLTPFPTLEEWLMVFDEANTVVALLDPANPEDVALIEEERKLLKSANVPFRLIPLSFKEFDPEAVLEAARLVKTLEKPIVLHSYHALASGKSPISEAFVQAYYWDVLPLPPSLFTTPMDEGPAEVIAPNVATGPSPTGPEFGTYLHVRGVRTAIHVGPITPEKAAYDAVAAYEGNILWIAVEGNSTYWLNLFQTDGPFYVYGPGAEQARETISRRLGPGIPRQFRDVDDLRAFEPQWATSSQQNGPTLEAASVDTLP